MDRNGVKLDPQQLQALCARYRIRELYVFGSILRRDFGPDSDVDFVVRLEPEARLSFPEFLDLQEALAAIVGRRVDLVLNSQLESPRANPYRRREILSTMERVYAA